MYAVKEMTPAVWALLFERYPMAHAMSLEIPQFVYPFYKDDHVIGYIRIEGKTEPEIKAFVVEEDDPAVCLFFLKASAYKLERYGFKAFYDREAHLSPFYPHQGIILFEDLFQGSCGGAR